MSNIAMATKFEIYQEIHINQIQNIDLIREKSYSGKWNREKSHREIICSGKKSSGMRFWENGRGPFLCNTSFSL